MQFVCEFALENAINSVLELQKCNLYYNYYTYNPPTSLPKRASDVSLCP